MATATIPTAVVLGTGTTGADVFTLTDDIATNGAINGNGGPDALVLTDAAADTFVLLGGAATYTAATDTWSVGGQALTGGFSTVTFSDGVAITAGVASSGTLDPAAGTPNGAPLPLNALNDYAWDGAAGSVTPFVPTSIVTVDGIDVATAGANFTSSANTGLFNVVGTNLSFTAATAAISAQGNVGDTATFTFDVVVTDGTETRTVSATFSTAIAFTADADTYVGTDAADTALAVAGDDVISGGEGNDTLNGGTGNDRILGENGDDTLVTSGGSDSVRGGNGDDTINGAAGAATDMQILGGGNGNDNITGGAGADTVYGSGGDDTIVDAGGNNILNGGGGDDNITGGTGNDTIRGGDGADVINGTSGTNELRGGAGADTISGGTGNDMIYSSLDGDDLTGLGGDDSFIIKTGTGDTTINDFGTGSDELVFTGTSFTSLADVLGAAYETNTGVTIEIDADTSLFLNGATLADLNNASTDFA